jgi:cellulose synthase/poly-beta-1,6-N-acetylglucosamine synthase-like glycosyltransferase
MVSLAAASLLAAQRRRTLRLGHLSETTKRTGFPRRELGFTLVGLAVTLSAALLATGDILLVLVERLASKQWGAAVAQCAFLFVVAFLIYGAGVYHLARLGYLRRLLAHVPVSRGALERVYQEPDPPLVTTLVPSYMEDARVVRRTLMCAALQEYPHRRVVLLIDDAQNPAGFHEARLLKAARALPGEIDAVLEEPRKLCADAQDALHERRATGRIDGAQERRLLAQLHADIAAWFERRGDGYEIADHADRLFVETTFHGPARQYRGDANRLFDATADAETQFDERALLIAYARLAARFRVELASFERKRYENLSHAANKAMNLNSYIGLLGQNFCEVTRGVTCLLEPAGTRSPDLAVPPSEFLLIVDADSLLTPDYALRLIHLMRQPGNERVAVAQTPYNAFPGAPTSVERIAGATTDIQYLIHQGFTRYGATYWVGANAVVRTAALRDIATTEVERGYEVTRFIQDRTVIEDTESTVDLLSHGWRLHNYPERLAYSETPPDFGALLIQRRRWANGGLIILPKLVRHLARRAAGRARVLQAFMMTHYLSSLAAVNLGLLMVLAFSFENSMRSVWLPFTAVPYYVLYARDLGLVGYRIRDILGVYALNLVLIPVNLVGVFSSIEQAITGKRTAFGRTPKVKGRTRVPAIYLIAELSILMVFAASTFRDLVEARPIHALFLILNISFLAYGVARFIGIRHTVGDLAAPFERHLSSSPEPAHSQEA